MTNSIQSWHVAEADDLVQRSPVPRKFAKPLKTCNLRSYLQNAVLEGRIRSNYLRSYLHNAVLEGRIRSNHPPHAAGLRRGELPAPDPAGRRAPAPAPRRGGRRRLPGEAAAR